MRIAGSVDEDACLVHMPGDPTSAPTERIGSMEFPSDLHGALWHVHPHIHITCAYMHTC